MLGDPIQDNAGRATVIGHVIVCECGAAVTTVIKRTRTAVALQCAECKQRLSVKGGTAPVRINRGEIEWVKKDNRVVYPDPHAGAQRTAGDGVGSPASTSDAEVPASDASSASPTTAQDADPITTMRLSMLASTRQRLSACMQIVRLLQWGDDRFRGATWHGLALEYMIADFEAGVPLAVQRIYQRMQALVDAEVDAYLASTGRVRVTDRQMRTIRARVFDKMYDALEITGSEEE